jgi:hypothetical protein
MGTWGLEPLANDAACDFITDLVDADDLAGALFSALTEARVDIVWTYAKASCDVGIGAAACASATVL